jgi:hypothetical protein
MRYFHLFTRCFLVASSRCFRDTSTCFYEILPGCLHQILPDTSTCFSKIIPRCFQDTSEYFKDTSMRCLQDTSTCFFDLLLSYFHLLPLASMRWFKRCFFLELLPIASMRCFLKIIRWCILVGSIRYFRDTSKRHQIEALKILLGCFNDLIHRRFLDEPIICFMYASLMLLRDTSHMLAGCC